MKVFTTNYHISVNKTLVEDLIAIGCEVIMPRDNWKRIDFYAPNDEHLGRGARLISYEEFLRMPPMAILAPCMQLVDIFKELYDHRGGKDVMIYLTANSDAINWFDPKGTDYLMTHDLDFHRMFEGKYKMLYFSKPTVNRNPKSETELRRSYDERKVKLYINNFDQGGYEPEFAAANKFRELYKERTGWRTPFFGYGMPDGWLQPADKAHDEMVDSMFSLVFKRRDTWGQMVNESMMLGTPCVFLSEFLYSTFTEYLITPDTAIVGDTIEELVNKITNLTFEQYESLVNEAYSQSYMYCDDGVRHKKLAWLFDKVAKDPKLA